MGRGFKGIISPRNEEVLFQVIRKELLKPGIKNWFLRLISKIVTKKVIKAFDNSVLDYLPEEMKKKLIPQVNLLIDLLKKN